MTSVQPNASNHIETNQDQKVQRQAAALVIAGTLLLIAVMANFWTARWISQTVSQPLTILTLTQPGCELINRSGIATEINNGICTAVVRYQKDRNSLGGTVEKDGVALININGNHVVGIRQLDDGSVAPWSKEHIAAIIVEIGLLLFIFLIVMVTVMIGSKSEVSNYQSE